MPDEVVGNEVAASTVCSCGHTKFMHTDDYHDKNDDLLSRCEMDECPCWFFTEPKDVKNCTCGHLENYHLPGTGCMVKSDNDPGIYCECTMYIEAPVEPCACGHTKLHHGGGDFPCGDQSCSCYRYTTVADEQVCKCGHGNWTHHPVKDVGCFFVISPEKDGVPQYCQCKNFTQAIVVHHEELVVSQIVSAQMFRAGLCNAIASGLLVNEHWTGEHPADCFCMEKTEFHFDRAFADYLVEAITFAAQNYVPAPSEDWLARQQALGELTWLLDNVVNSALVVDVIPPPPPLSWFESAVGMGIDPAVPSVAQSTHPSGYDQELTEATIVKMLEHLSKAPLAPLTKWKTMQQESPPATSKSHFVKATLPDGKEYYVVQEAGNVSPSVLKFLLQGQKGDSI